MKFTIQTHFQHQDDDGKTIRATSAFWTEAEGIPEAYATARDVFVDRPEVKFGFIVKGHHALA